MIHAARTYRLAGGIVGVACAGLLVAAWAPAYQEQPVGKSAEARPELDQPGKKISDDARPENQGKPPREAYKARLERRLAEAKESQQKLEQGIKMLGEGASVDDVRKVVPEGGGGFRGGPDQFGGGPGWDGGGGPGRDGDGGGRPDRQYSDADRETVKEILTHAAPDMAAKIEELSKKDPEAAKQKIREVFPRIRFLLDLRKRNPEMYKLRLEDLSLAHEAIPIAKQLLQLREQGVGADDERVKPLRAQLRTIIAKQFENRAKFDAWDIEMLEKRVAEKRKRLEEMKSNADEKIDGIIEGVITHAGKAGEFGGLDGPRRPDDGERGGKKPQRDKQ